MSKEKIISSHSEDNILGERNILSKINHPFIVNMYFSFQDNDNLYLIMDLLSGGDLRYHISHKKPCVFNEIQTKFFISNIIIALEYIHSQKIVHRDIKPENLVLDINGYVRLTDFGIALINKDNNLKESSGTAGYMAPEVMMQQGHSYPADFFALGVIGYEFMIGNRPYYGKNRKQIKKFIISYQAKIKFNNSKKGWSQNSKDFINRLLQRRPIKRLGYSGIKELKNHLWLKDIDWDALKKKKIIAPYKPKQGKDFFDKKYCQEEKTIEKYKNIININDHQHAFDNYTFINLKYISKFYNENFNQNQINNNLNENDFRKMSFSESLIKGKSFSASFKSSNSNVCIKINRNFFSTNKLSKSIKNNINKKDYKNLPSNKDNLSNSTNQLKRYYDIGIPKEKDNIKNNEKIVQKEIRKGLQKKENNKENKHCFSSDNIMKEQKSMNLKEIHRLVKRSIVNSPIFKINGMPPMNSNKKENGLINSKSYKSYKYKSILKKTKANRKIFNEEKKCFNEKEKELLFNSTTKEKTMKEKTMDNKDKNTLKIIKKKISNNKGKSTQNEELALCKKDKKDNFNETKKIKKNTFLQTNYFFNHEKNNYLSYNSRNKLIKNIKTKTKEEIKNNRTSNKEKEYSIKVIHKKVYKMKNNINKSKDFITHKPLNKNNSANKNISVKKNHFIKNYKTINSLSLKKNHLHASKSISSLKKKNKINRKNNRFFNSKGFIEFRKRKISNFQEKPKHYNSLSNRNIIKEDKKEKEENKEIKENISDEDNNKNKVLKFDYNFKNLDKEPPKHNYYILDNYVSI